MQKKRMIIWGSFEEFETFLPQLRIEEQKQNIEIVAVLFGEENIIREIMGYPVIVAEDLLRLEYDYIMGLDDSVEPQMLKILDLLKISRQKLLMGRILLLPEFDFAAYLRVRESRVSIISDNCWGGMTYHSLNMPFLSPFINMFVREEDYGRLLRHFGDYMNEPLRFVRMQHDEARQDHSLYPVGRIGDIELHFNHSTEYDEARSVWEKRKERLNPENIFVKMNITTEQGLEEFRGIPYRKIGFSAIPAQNADIIDCSGWERHIKGKYGGRFWEFINWQARGNVDIKLYNILKLLLGEADYCRIK